MRNGAIANAEFGCAHTPRTRASAKCDWLSGTYASDRRESQCGVRNDKLEYCSGSIERLIPHDVGFRPRGLPRVEALDCSASAKAICTAKVGFCHTKLWRPYSFSQA
ncbi:MAG: hypothetical protein IJZ04_02295 [Clostridia bacterium]|nr:hypothetical protein [Clostridia bacterium]